MAMVRIVKPPTISERLFEANKFEYKTRHLIDGRIVQCDQRISIVAGYMADEVSGLSPFTFMHKDDVRWVMVALRQSKFYRCLLNIFKIASICLSFYMTSGDIMLHFFLNVEQT